MNINPKVIARFPVCLPFTLAQERNVATASWGDPRNFDNDKHDPGGETQDGITQREYDAYRKRQDRYTQPVKLITESEGREIYYDSYWLPHCPDLAPGLDLQFFDASVNEGTTEATRLLQYVLNVDVDGYWGPQTAEAVKAIKDVAAVIKAFTTRRAAVYRQMKGFKYFGKDWERRTLIIGAEALKMAVGDPMAFDPKIESY